MKKKSLISIVVVSVFLLSGIAVVALAGFEPTPFHPRSEVIPALESVKSAAQNIVESIKDNSLIVGQVRKEFIWALEDVQSAAQDIVNHTEKHISRINREAVCSSYENMLNCQDDPCCFWVPNSDNRMMVSVIINSIMP